MGEKRSNPDVGTVRLAIRRARLELEHVTARLEHAKFLLERADELLDARARPREPRGRRARLGAAAGAPCVVRSATGHAPLARAPS